MLTVCHLAEKAQNINRNTENYDHKRGITSTKLASKERSPTVAAVASTISSRCKYNQQPHATFEPAFSRRKTVLSGGRGSSLRYWPRPPREHYFLRENAGPK